MAEKIVFGGAQLLSFTRKASGGKATFSSSLNSAVINKMGWAEVPEAITGASLEGDLAASSLVLTPKDKELARHETQIEISRVAKFETVRLELEGKSGKGHRTELRFTAYFADPVACKKLEAYLLTCGKSTVTVSYEKQPQQADLPGVEVAPDPQMEMSGIQ